jgi:hypothetical protein
MDSTCCKAACSLLLLIAPGCTPTVTLRSGRDFEEATTIADRYCAAVRAPAGEESQLFSVELQHLSAGVEHTQRRQYMTSSGGGPTCVPGAVKAFGRPPHIISMDVGLNVGNVTDQLHLRRVEGGWRVDDLVYGRPRPIGTVMPYGLKMALRSFRKMQPPQPSAASAEDGGGNQHFRGRVTVGFEIFTFRGCWMAPGRHWSSFKPPPFGSGGVFEYEVEFTGTRLGSPGAERGGSRYGHLGRYSCEYQVHDLISIRRASPKTMM